MKVQRYRSIPGMESGFPRVRCKVRFTVTQHKAICGQKEVILKLDLSDSVQQNKFIGGYWILPLAGWMFSPSILFPCYDTIPLALWCPSPLSKFSSLHLAGESVKIPVWYFLKKLLRPKHSSNSKFELLHTSIQNVQWWRQWSLNTRWDIGRSLSCGNFLVFHVLGKCYIAGIKVASSWWHAGPVYAKYVLTTPVCQQRCLFLHLYFFKFSGGTRECQTGTCDPGP